MSDFLGFHCNKSFCEQIFTPYRKKCNFPMTPHARPLVCWFLKRREVSLPCSYRSISFLFRPIRFTKNLLPLRALFYPTKLAYFVFDRKFCSVQPLKRPWTLISLKGISLNPAGSDFSGAMR